MTLRAAATASGVRWRWAKLSALLLVSVSIAPAYYHFIYFAGRFAPFIPLPVRFDINSVSDRTIYYFVSDQGPSQLAAGDSFTSVVSQIRAAADVWNGVDTSDLKLQFGGLASAGTPQAGPGIDVVFDDDMPPGIAARGGYVTLADINYFTNGGGFIPIVRSKLQLRRDLSQDPSYTDNFFLVLVHEFGHTIGLQHTLTSSVMATGITRATTKARPLGLDDCIGVSLLYPNSRFLVNRSSISGRVTFQNNGDAVNLASVVAITAQGDAVSALTNPDGSYRIDGLPKGQYLLYVHPLPAPYNSSEVTPANINLPQDIAQKPFPVSQAFDTIFYPGTKDPGQAQAVGVAPGQPVDGINFLVARRSTSATSSVELFGYIGQTAVKGVAPIRSGTRTTVVFTGPNLAPNNQVAPGLSVALLGQPGIVPGSLKYYTQGYLQVDVQPQGDLGPRHLVLSLNNDIYVLPSSVSVVKDLPPSITSVTSGYDDQGNRVAMVVGNTLSPGTRVWFDGAPASGVRQNSDGSLLVTPPAASGSYKARVSALNADGQTSGLALGKAAPPAFSYDPGNAPSLSVSQNAVTAGQDTLIEVSGFNTNFVDGQVVVGFGSSDVAVKRQWVVSPTRMLLNVSVNPAAPAASTALTVASGLLLVSQPLSFQILPAGGRVVSLRAPVLNQATGLAGVPAGGTAILNVFNMPSGSTGWGVSVSGQSAAIVSSSGGQIVFTVPPGLQQGPAIVRVTTPAGDALPPIAMQIDGSPPAIVAASAGGTAIDSQRPAAAGDTIQLTVAGAYDFGTMFNAAALKVSIGGIDQSISSFTYGSQQGSVVLNVLLSAFLSSGQQPAVVTVDTRVSAAFPVWIK